ncbi:MAG: DNA polymerase III subunit alpha, partial [Ignavibacteriaceae bacterium]
MEKLDKISKTELLDMSKYNLPECGLNRLFSSIQRIIKESGIDIFNYEIVFHDNLTKKLIREGKTIGCFYIESPGMRSLLKRTNCETFELLTAVSSVIRPGVAESGMMKAFIDRHKNPKLRKYLVPEMEKYLGETYGVMIYQE